MSRLKVLGPLALVAWAGGRALAQGTVPSPRPPVLIRLSDPSAVPIRLSGVAVDASVVGRLARTRIDLTFRNPNGRVLEGELQFPLLEGQQVTAFALDIDGQWRGAVPVEKARGQEVFEEVTRTRVDPALLEATAGNNFKLRVYPIPANGERRVSLTVSERLGGSGGGAAYRLALPGGERLDSFAFRLTAPGRRAEQAKVVRGLTGAELWKGEREARLEVARRDVRPEPLVEIALAEPDAPSVLAEERDGRHYFYAEPPVRPQGTAPRPKPARVALVWDASGSGAARDHGREMALLDAYFKALGEATVRLTLARDDAEDGGKFVVRGGNWSALRQELERAPYDGATNLAAFRPVAPADAVLLFTDGLGNYGEARMPRFDAPLFALSASASADLVRLRHAAEATGGALVDLTRVSTVTALRALREAGPRLVGLRSNGASELVASPVESGRVAIAGILTEPEAVVELEWRMPAGTVERQRVKVDRGRSSLSFAAQEWARLKLQGLEAEPELHRAEITRIGKEFALVTRGTSLIVLDRVEDYVRYEIAPPEALRAEYDRMRGQARQTAAREKSDHLERIVQRFQEKAAWWKRDFPKGDRPKPEQAMRKGARSEAAPRTAAMAPPAATMERGPEAGVAAGAAAGGVMPGILASAPAPMALRDQAVGEDARSAAKSAATGGAPGAAPATIRLQRWNPDAPYADRLRKAAKGDLYHVYLDERPSFTQSTAFFLDSADLFFERGEERLALRILSNLAEMDLENRHVLRILGYRLLQAKRPALAVPVLERVLELAPNEPQSWRDLGLACAENRQAQKAFDHLAQVVLRPWHDRFPDVELIALAELNALVSTTPEKVNTSGLDPRLLRNLPLDLRAVLTWDADNTDIDLWVTDPNGEKAFYGHRLTYQGGAMSRDFTGGYGPEEFSLKTAKPGRYLVQAQFYGHRQQVVSGATTLQLRLTTGFGTPAQKEQSVTLRLKSGGEVVTVGEFVVEPGAR